MFKKAICVALTLCALISVSSFAQVTRVAAYGCTLDPKNVVLQSATLCWTLQPGAVLSDDQVLVQLTNSLGGTAPTAWTVVTLAKQKNASPVIELREYPLAALNKILPGRGLSRKAMYGVYINVLNYDAPGGVQQFNNTLTVSMHFPQGSAPFFFDGVSAAASLDDWYKNKDAGKYALDAKWVNYDPTQGVAIFTFNSWSPGDPCGGG